MGGEKKKTAGNTEVASFVASNKLTLQETFPRLEISTQRSSERTTEVHFFTLALVSDAESEKWFRGCGSTAVEDTSCDRKVAGLKNEASHLSGNELRILFVCSMQPGSYFFLVQTAAIPNRRLPNKLPRFSFHILQHFLPKEGKSSRKVPIKAQAREWRCEKLPRRQLAERSFAEGKWHWKRQFELDKASYVNFLSYFNAYFSLLKQHC